MVGSPPQRQQQQQPTAAASASLVLWLSSSWFARCWCDTCSSSVCCCYYYYDIIMVPRVSIYNMPHSSPGVIVLPRVVRCKPSSHCQLRAVASTTGAYLHLALLRAHCCCCELRAAGRAYSYLLLVRSKSKAASTDVPLMTPPAPFFLAIQA